MLQVGGVAQPVSPEQGESASAGGPIYLVSLLFVVPVVVVLVWYLKKNHPDVQQLLPEVRELIAVMLVNFKIKGF